MQLRHQPDSDILIAMMYRAYVEIIYIALNEQLYTATSDKYRACVLSLNPLIPHDCSFT